jgi:Spy/CpxP family protein refolding chaperone
MKEESTYRWMVWAIVVLAMMNLTTLLTILYHRNKPIENELVGESDLLRSENSSVQFSGRYFRDQLNLRRDQMDRFVGFNPVFRQQARNININLNRIRHQMLTQMAAENSDVSKLNQLSDSIGYLHSELKKLTFRYYLDIKNVCDRDQRAELERMFGEMFTSDRGMGQNGRGRQNGMRYGRRFNN